MNKVTKMITLKEGMRCKCPCRHYTGDNGLDYWFRQNVVYSTNCHEENPIKAK